jgi:hypothetical protein
MSIYQFPGPYVWKRKFPGHEELKARVLPKILAAAEANAGNLSFRWDNKGDSTILTNYFTESVNPWGYFEKGDIVAIALESAREFEKSSELPGASFPKDYAIKGFWWNRYVEGSLAPPHVHSPGISGVYILEQTGRCPLEFMHVNHYAADSEEPNVYYTPDAEEGDILLFPGTLPHWVRPAQSPRTTVSFNLRGQLTN